MWFQVCILVAASFAIAFLFLAASFPVLCRFFPDRPNIRSSHHEVTPRGGGVAFVLVSAAASFAFFFPSSPPSLHPSSAALCIAALPLALVGLIDDHENLPVSWRYGTQLFTSVLMFMMSPLVVFLPILPLVVIASTAVINFINFMDGLDGLVAGCMAVVFAAAALTGIPVMWPLVGALLGFLLWNWSPAKLFMGDVGSTFLGAVFAGVVLQQASFQSALGLLLVATPLLADACFCVLRRLLAGQRVIRAHRLHLFQRLHQAGWTHASVASLYIISTAVLGFALLAGGLFWVMGLVAALLLVGVWLDQRVAVPFEASPPRV